LVYEIAMPNTLLVRVAQFFLTADSSWKRKFFLTGNIG